MRAHRRTHRTLAALVAGAALALASAAPAAAQETPLDFSAGDQYVETVPTAKGPRVADRERSKRSRSGLSPRVQRLIQSQGGATAGTLSEVASSEGLGAPTASSGSGGSGDGSGKGSGADRDSGEGSPSVPSATISAVGGGDATLGWLAVALLAITTVALGAFGYQRHRNRDASG
jgi:hypothetical protein